MCSSGGDVVYRYTTKCNKLDVPESGQSCHGNESAICDVTTLYAMVHSTGIPRRVKILE
jgi:hypothetical protein